MAATARPVLWRRAIGRARTGLARTRLPVVLRVARLVRRPLPFVICEVIRRDAGARRWQLRTGEQLVLRAGTRDVDIVHEIFARGVYDPPAEVRAALGKGPRLVADVGANIGLFGLAALRTFPRAAVHSYEPDPANVALLRAVHERSADRDRWTLREVAAGIAPGEMRLVTGDGPESRPPRPNETDRADLVSVPMIDLFTELDGVDLLKIDIEGAEWPLLQDPRFGELGAKAIALEYHGGWNPAPGPRDAAHQILRSHGYETRDVEWVPQMGCGQLWAWRPASPPAAPAERGSP